MLFSGYNISDVMYLLRVCFIFFRFQSVLNWSLFFMDIIAFIVATVFHINNNFNQTYKPPIEKKITTQANCPSNSNSYRFIIYNEYICNEYLQLCRWQSGNPLPKKNTHTHNIIYFAIWTMLCWCLWSK